jgi:hypothetical protein
MRAKPSVRRAPGPQPMTSPEPAVTPIEPRSTSFPSSS